MVAVAAASIAGFSIVRGNRGIAPVASPVQSDHFVTTEAAAAAPIDTIDNLLQSIAQPPAAAAQRLSATPTAAAEMAPPSDAGQPHEAGPSGAVPKREGTAAAKMPVGAEAAALPSPEHMRRRGYARDPRRHVASKQRVRQQAPASNPQPVRDELRPGSYNGDFDRGFSYGGPAAHSDTGS
jgi:hypothetical protein